MNLSCEHWQEWKTNNPEKNMKDSAIKRKLKKMLQVKQYVLEETYDKTKEW